MIALINHFSRTGLVLPCILGLPPSVSIVCARSAPSSLPVCFTLSVSPISLTHTHTPITKNPFFLLGRSPWEYTTLISFPWPPYTNQNVVSLNTWHWSSVWLTWYFDNKRRQFCVLSPSEGPRHLRQVEGVASSLSFHPAGLEYCYNVKSC